MTMQTQVQIDFQGMAAKPDVEDMVAGHLQELESRFGRITAGRVILKGPGSHHRTGGLFDINIRLALPEGREVNVGHTRQDDERYADLNFALNDAFKRARRQLQDRVRRLQRAVKQHAEQPIGTVAKLDPAGEFGFIETADGRQIYFHRNSVLNGGFARLGLGARVVYVEEAGEKGPQASTVKPLKKHALKL
ncbi:HPF/RaiA family ribosome-associated protein [Bosea sp. CS1GBMeth4]|uniref:HPF/RaiA family ribosome-associated protein n=1 Tax=Bosea sp. CS1GBMeth4 TaxID=1892849 RepID=UPI001FCEFE64|nr:HPF/RaiA family ribosome-associated protein [Bosea sp. CS1GBMeth4]